MGYNLTSSLPSGYVTNGTVDYTTYLQNGINANQICDMPPFPVMVSDVGLNIPSNRTINFMYGSDIKMKPSSNDSYKIINISARENVTINNPSIEGDRDTHIGETGESGMLIAIMGSKNVTINGGKLTKSWADGIYLGTKTVGGIANVECRNIQINNVNISDSRRNAISIISVVGCVINDAYLSYSGGGSRFHDPQAGLGFEPNYRINKLEGIVVNNLKTVGHANHGLYIGISNWYKSPESMSAETTKVIDITVNNWQDTKSGYPLLLSWNKNVVQPAGYPVLTNISGSVRFLNVEWNYLTDKPKLIENYVIQPVGGVQLIISKVKVRRLAPTSKARGTLSNIATTNGYVTGSFGGSANLTMIDR